METPPAPTPEPAPPPTGSAFHALRQFTTPPPRVQRCELCALKLPPEHPHLLQSDNRRILCACAACAVLFGSSDTQRYRRIPDRILALPGFELADHHGHRLAIPIALAFLIPTGAGGATALYPSPAGLTESPVSPEDWAELVQHCPPLASIEPHVQAMLINRIEQRRDQFIAPIDLCFRLAGLIRLHWRGFTGGDAARREIDAFFADLHRRARPAAKDAPCPS